VGVGLLAGGMASVGLTVEVRVMVRDGLGVTETEAEGEGVPCWSGAACEAPARSISQPPARKNPITTASPNLPHPKDRVDCQRVCMARVIILLLFYAKNIISCSLIHPIYKQGIHWYLWTSQPSP
jgi:hypothetical protein